MVHNKAKNVLLELNSYWYSDFWNFLFKILPSGKMAITVEVIPSSFWTWHSYWPTSIWISIFVELWLKTSWTIADFSLFDRSRTLTTWGSGSAVKAHSRIFPHCSRAEIIAGGPRIARSIESEIKMLEDSQIFKLSVKFSDLRH